MCSIEVTVEPFSSLGMGEKSNLAKGAARCTSWRFEVPIGHRVANSKNLRVWLNQGRGGGVVELKKRKLLQKGLIGDW